MAAKKTRPATEEKKATPPVEHEKQVEAAPAPPDKAVIATPAGTAVAEITDTDALAAMAGEGFEDVRPSDMSLPFFKLLQSSTPETKRSEPDYVEGAIEGLWFDTITKECFNELVFVPCRMVTHFIEWDADKLGVFVKNHGSNDAIMRTTHVDEKTGNNVTDHGTRIVPTATWFGIVIAAVRETGAGAEKKRIEIPNLDRRAVIALSGTQQKFSRQWVSDLSSLRLTDSRGTPFRPPMFGMTYRLGAAPTKNDKGSWFLVTTKRAGWTLDWPDGRRILEQAKAFSAFSRDLQPVFRDEELPARGSGNFQVTGNGPHQESPPFQGNEEIPF